MHFLSQFYIVYYVGSFFFLNSNLLQWCRVTSSSLCILLLPLPALALPQGSLALELCLPRPGASRMSKALGGCAQWLCKRNSMPASGTSCQLLLKAFPATGSGKVILPQLCRQTAKLLGSPSEREAKGGSKIRNLGISQLPGMCHRWVHLNTRMFSKLMLLSASTFQNQPYFDHILLHHLRSIPSSSPRCVPGFLPGGWCLQQLHLQEHSLICWCWALKAGSTPLPQAMLVLLFQIILR